MAKYIDAERLRAEINERMLFYAGQANLLADTTTLDGFDEILSIIDSLQQEQPEQPTMGYDEAYLNEKIAKATKSWKGVDVDKFMDEIRGREPEVDLEKEIESAGKDVLRQAHKHNKRFDIPQNIFSDVQLMDIFKAGVYKGVELERDSKNHPGDTVLFQKGVAEGKRLMMEDMPKWHKVERGSCFDKHTNFILSAREGHFYCYASEVPRDGYIILVDELERLPKED